MGTFEISVISLFPILQGHNTLPHFVGIVLCWKATIWGILFKFEKPTKDHVLSNQNDKQLELWSLRYSMNSFIPQIVGFELIVSYKMGNLWIYVKLTLPQIVGLWYTSPICRNFDEFSCYNLGNFGQIWNSLQPIHDCFLIL